jgi:hypothetical protein
VAMGSSITMNFSNIRKLIRGGENYFRAWNCTKSWSFRVDGCMVGIESIACV